MRRCQIRGIGTAELLVGMALAAGVLTMLVAGCAVAGRILIGLGTRAELEDIAALVVDTARFDLRRSGFGLAPTEGIDAARTDRVTVTADLDGDGRIDANSEETITLACLTAPGRVSRIVGAQSLPLASDTTACRFSYVDASGTALVPSATGLNAVDRAQIRAVRLDFTLAPQGSARRTARTVTVARRSLP